VDDVSPKFRATRRSVPKGGYVRGKKGFRGIEALLYRLISARVGGEKREKRDHREGGQRRRKWDKASDYWD